MRRSLCFVCVAVVGLVVWAGSVAFAQERRQSPTGNLPGGLVDLALRENVRKELGLADDSAEIAALRKLSEAQRAEFDALPRDRRFNNQRLPSEIANKYRSELKTLLKPEQFDRLRQIAWHQLDLDAYVDEDVIQALDITDKQHGKLNAARQTFMESAYGRRGADDQPRANPLERMRTAAAAWEKTISEILSKDQQARFNVLRGKPLDLQPAVTAERLRQGVAAGRFNGLAGFALLEPVQKELGIDQDSKTTEALQNVLQEGNRKRFASASYPTPEEADNPLLLSARILATTDAEVSKLLTPDQYTRLMQLDLQLRGSTAVLRDAEVWKALGITAEQQQKLGELDVKFTQENYGFARTGQYGPRVVPPSDVKPLSARERFAAREQQVMQVLTDDQRTKLIELKGKPFDVEQLRPARVLGLPAAKKAD